jgi:lipoprotein-anchoring transpeptidase ErfK/SrfK
MRRKALVVAAVAAAIVIGALVAFGGGSSVKAGGGSPRTFTPVDRAQAAVHRVAPRAVHRRLLPAGPGTLIAQVMVATKLRAAPHGRVLAPIGPRDQFGTPDVVAVVKVRSGWLGVLSEFAGNGRVGWIPESAVIFGRDRWSLRASLSTHTLTVLQAGHVRARYTIGIGALQSPTPTGRFAVTDKLVTNQPEGPYGCCILALTATAPHAIPNWNGGDRVAIHATPDTETIGEPDSHGCMHVTNPEAHWLVYHVPTGTLIRISG